MLGALPLSFAVAVLPLAVQALSIQECSACLEFCPGAGGDGNPNSPGKPPNLGRPFREGPEWGIIEGPHGLWWVPSIPGSPGHHIVGWWYIPGIRTSPPVTNLPPSFFQPVEGGSVGSIGAFGWWLIPGMSNTPPEFIRPGEWHVPSIDGFDVGRGCNLVPDPHGAVSCSYVTGSLGGITGSMGSRPPEPTWSGMRLIWNQQFPPGGYPQPWVLPRDQFASGGMVLDIIESGYNMAQFGIFVDGQLVAQSEKPSQWGNENAYCEALEQCSRGPFSRVSGNIPAGTHRVEVRMIDGSLRTYSGSLWENWKPGFWRLRPVGNNRDPLLDFGQQRPLVPKDGGGGGDPGPIDPSGSLGGQGQSRPGGQDNTGGQGNQGGFSGGQGGASGGQGGVSGGQGIFLGDRGDDSGGQGGFSGGPGAASGGQGGVSDGQGGFSGGQGSASGGQGGASGGLAGRQPGNQITPWAVFVMNFDAQHVRGQSYPAPFKIPRANFDRDTLLEVVDKYYQTCHYKLYVDGQLAGETDEKSFQNDAAVCSVAADCMTKGFGHGYALIPAGNHNVEIHWTDGPKASRSGFIYTHNQGLWRLVEAA